MTWNLYDHLLHKHRSIAETLTLDGVSLKAAAVLKQRNTLLRAEDETTKTVVWFDGTGDTPKNER